jgi:hypothetical protein
MHSDMWLPAETGKTMLDTVRQGARRKYRFVTGPGLEQQEYPGLVKLEKKIADGFQIRYEDVVFGNTLFRNRGGGNFDEVSDRAGVETFWPWGVAVGDFDNDGYEDIYLPSGMGYSFFYWPSALLMNKGDGTFTDRADAEGIEPPRGGIFQDKPIGGQPAPRSSRCAATADFDGDGRLEIVVNNFNDVPYYYKNQFPRRNYIAFRLRGTRSNRDAIGALVKLYAGKEVMVRQVQGAGGYLSQSSKTVHFGLGSRPRVDRVEIRWPSGRQQTIQNPALNRRHDVVEPER